MGLFRAIRGHGLAILLAALALTLPGIARAQEIMPVSQVKIGMKGYGLTVFKGTKIERFDVEVLGVLKRQNLGGDLVLVMMSGGPITQRGANIIGGMSGSPVYINGKLLGAVAYGMTFPKEPIAMITPIQDMMEALDPKLDSQSPTLQAPALSLTKPLEIGGKTISKVELQRPGQNSEAAGDTLGMVPLATPVMVAGASPRSLKYLSQVFENAQMEPVAGPGSAAQTVSSEVPLLPGSAVGVQLMTGDIDMTGVGTLTYRKGNRILAFGHPMVGIGTAEMPMTTAYIYDVFSSVMRSFKIGAPIKMVGSINQDRPWAIAGTVGKLPKMIPVSLVVKNLSSGRQKTLNVEVVNNPMLTLPLILTAASEGVMRVHPNVTESMAKVRFDVSSEHFPSITRENVFFDPQSIDGAALRDLTMVLAMLSQHPTQADKVKKINVNIEVWDKRQTATVQRIFLKKSKFEPGETVDVGVVLKPYNQDEIVRTLQVKIPETAGNGSVNLVVSGGGSSIAVEAPPAQDPQSAAAGGQPVVIAPLGGTGMDLPEMIKRFLERDRNNDLVAKLILSTPGVNIKGEKLLGLPATMAEVYRSPKATGVRAEREEIKKIESTDWVISGVQALSLTIQRKTHAEKSTGTKSDSSTSTTTSSTVSTDASSVIIDLGDEEFDAKTPSPSPMADASKLEIADKKDSSGESGKKDESKSESKKDGKLDSKVIEASTEEVAAASSAVKTVIRLASKWTTSAQADFEQGTGIRTAATSLGDVRLTRALGLVYDSPEPYIWSLAVGKDGLYAGTGNSGRIYRLDASGKAKLFSETGALAVQAMTIGKDGTLYAATTPNAIIYRIGADGKPVKLYDAEERLILALATDESGNLYAATGGGVGRIYRITPDGTATRFFSSPEPHILSLACGSDGAIYAGTGENGIIYKLSKDGIASVLYDAGENNISALAVDAKGNVYAGTGTKGVVYRIASDGTVKKLTDKPKATVSALAVEPSGSVLAASGSQVYSIAPDETVTSFDELSGAQLTALAVDSAGTLYAGTANTGSIYKSGLEGIEGTYESSTHDAGAVARWGQIAWVATAPEGTDVRMQTRSGNTAEPDETWSGWSPNLSSGDPIASPAARFIQYRATLSSKRADLSPRLRSVVIGYLPKNQAPTLSISAPTASTMWSKKQSIKWTASDPDKDTLSAEIFTSADNGATWSSLAKVDKESSYSWDTTQAKDGTYLLKVVVSDRKSNAIDSQSVEKISEPVVVCNKLPSLFIDGDKAKLPVSADKKVSIEGRASSKQVPIVGVEWQVNGNGWSAAAPSDGIFDSDYEGFSINTDPLPSGQDTLEIRITDAAGNSTTEKLSVKVP